MAAVLPQELFLPHSTVDRDFVERLAHALRRHGVPVWYSERNIIGAQQWHDEIGDALRRCDWFAVVLSQSSVNSMWVKRELMKAFQPRRLENRIIPIVLEQADYERLSWVLDSFQMVDFTDSFENGMRDLLRIWGIGYRNL